MIKFTGFNWKKGSGDYYLFGYLRDGKGNGMFYLYFYSNPDGNGFGNGECFGDGYNFGDREGGGRSSDSYDIKEEFQKYD